MPREIRKNPRAMVVHSLSDLANARFGSANFINFPRELKGDFNSLARTLGAFLFAQLHGDNCSYWRAEGKEYGFFTAEGLRGLTLSFTAGERLALDEILADMIFASPQDGSWAPQLRVIGRNAYAGTGSVGRFHTDVDPATAECLSQEKLEQGGLGCCYNAPVTQSLRNEDAKYRSYLWFTKKRSAPILEDMRPGDLYRHAGFMKDPNFLPYVHRAPTMRPSDPPRLLLRA